MLDIGKKFKSKSPQKGKYYVLKQQNEFFQILDISKSDYILYSPVTSPLISFETINDCINYFETEKLKNLATTSLIKHHLWLNGKPLNYQIDKSLVVIFT